MVVLADGVMAVFGQDILPKRRSRHKHLQIACWHGCQTSEGHVDRFVMDTGKLGDEKMKAYTYISAEEGILSAGIRVAERDRGLVFLGEDYPNMGTKRWQRNHYVSLQLDQTHPPRLLRDGRFTDACLHQVIQNKGTLWEECLYFVKSPLSKKERDDESVLLRVKVEVPRTIFNFNQFCFRTESGQPHYIVARGRAENIRWNDFIVVLSLRDVISVSNARGGRDVFSLTEDRFQHQFIPT